MRKVFWLFIGLFFFEGILFAAEEQKLLPLQLSSAESPQGTCKEGNCKDGKGKFTFPDGSVYDGFFLNGRFNGSGSIQYADKKTCKGTFKNGIFAGKVTCEWTDKTTFEGEYNNNFGYGTITTPTGEKIEGNFNANAHLHKHNINLELGYQTSTFRDNSNQTINQSLFNTGIGFYRLSTNFYLFDIPWSNEYKWNFFFNSAFSMEGANLTVSPGGGTNADLKLVQAFNGSGGLQIGVLNFSNNFKLYVPIRLEVLAKDSYNLMNKQSYGIGLIDLSDTSFWKYSKFEFGYRLGNFLFEANSNYLYANAIAVFNIQNSPVIPFMSLDLSLQIGNDIKNISAISTGNIYELSLFVGVKKDAEFIGDIISNVFTPGKK
jgi:hypothetical protein